MATGPIGIVTGMRAEAAIARLWSPLVVCTGGRSERSAVLAHELIEQGATALVSFGIAGGLAPELACGTIVVARSVLLPDGAIESDDGWQRRLRAHLIARGAVTVVGSVLGGARIVDRAADKAALFQRTGALAVDLESAGVARVAAETGRPFAVLRAIADPAGRDLPAAALVGLKPDGTVALLPVLRSLLGAPRQLPDLLRAARDTRTALRALLGGAGDLGGMA